MIIIPQNWIKEPDENGDGFLQARVKSGDAGFPIPIETHNVALNDVALGTEQDFEFLIEGDSGIRVYTDEENYYNSRSTSLAAESFVPAGLFSPSDDENFVQTARAIIHGKVVETYDDPAEFGFDSGDTIFTLTCLGCEFDAVIPNEAADIPKLEIGNIITGIYWIQGWPKEQ